MPDGNISTETAKTPPPVNEMRGGGPDWTGPGIGKADANIISQQNPTPQEEEQKPPSNLSGVDTTKAADDAAGEINNIRNDLKEQDEKTRAQTTIPTPNQSGEAKTSLSALVDRFRKKPH